MNSIAIRQIEEAALNAWPALQQTFYDGWVLRFSLGYTKRANSVNPVYASSLDVDQKIDFCEQTYRQQDLPPIFRITPLADTNLDPVLERRGYLKFHPTRVMTLDLHDWESPVSGGIQLRELPLEQWMGVYSEVSGSIITKQPAHGEILRGIISPRLTAALEISGQWVACGLGVLERGMFGLFDIVTHADFRNQGLGSQLVSEMLVWAYTLRATLSYLQVMDDNLPAYHLYRKLGYQDQYGYWYRVTGTEEH
jgi:GNAT superfamily N-acetyltransferase